MKDYLGFENARNKEHAATYTKLMKLAFGANAQCFIGHHLSFEMGGDLSTENEIPSADALIFDHDVMNRVFGDEACQYMMNLANLPCGERDKYLATILEYREIPA